MKKTIYPIFTVLFLISCQPKEMKETLKESENNNTKESERIVDSAMAAYDNEISNDTKSSYLNEKLTADSPVKILNSRFKEEEYSNFKSVELKYKNVSEKPIAAIRFEWYGENSFGEPADMGSSNGEGGGFMDDRLNPGKTDIGTWNVLSRDGKTIIGARAYEVVFVDGSKWKLKK